MTHEEIFEQIKDNFGGVKMINHSEIKLLTKDGREFVVDQNIWDHDYKISFHCGGDQSSCGDGCQAEGSEYWEISKRLH